jgi:hypothetical protein
MENNDVKVNIKESKIDSKNSGIDMGFGDHPANNPKIILPRTFRWTLTSESHPEIRWWFQSLKTDYVNKQIILEIYDDTKGVVYDWLQAIVSNPSKEDKLTLTHYDGCGAPLYLINFFGLKTTEHSTIYDYGKSEVLTHKIIISYKKIKRVNDLHVV